MQTIKLTTPITYNDKTYKEITLKSPKVKDIKYLNTEDKNMEGAIKLTASLSGIPELALEEMEAKDFIKVQEIIAGFLQDTKQIAKNS